MEKAKFINQSRLDILFIIDSTNSNSLHLKDIKINFNNMIEKIYNVCQNSIIYMRFIRYTDFSKINLGEAYIDINFTNKEENIYEKIESLEANKRGDEVEDLAGIDLLFIVRDYNICQMRKIN